eukprot:Hpha_TRINITY_DN22743_c0_g1::TRINITY_DN22743_c0_g1_i1::g.34098::m.34098/K05841/E2.4.1.173; sterol 3beta-glucosyltransferase
MGSCVQKENPQAQAPCFEKCPGSCSWQGRGCCVCCPETECCGCCKMDATGDRGLETGAEEGNFFSGRMCTACLKKAGVHQSTTLRPAKARVAPLRIMIIIVGSRGDVQPFVAFAMGLRRHGHSICIATTEKSIAWAFALMKSEGIDFFEIGGDPEVLMQYAVDHPNLISFNMKRIEQQKEQLVKMFDGAYRACEDYRPDVLVANPPLIVPFHLMERTRLPLQIHFTMPWSPTTVYPNPCAPGRGLFGNLQTHYIFEEMQWIGLKDIINDFRENTLKLPPIPVGGGGLQHRAEIPHLYCASTQLMPKPKDWGSHISVVGFWNLQSSEVFDEHHRDWDPDLVKFLEGHKREHVVYIGFGSIQTKDPTGLSQAVMGAIHRLKRACPPVRVLLSPGWAGLGEIKRKFVLHVEDFADLGIEFDGVVVKSVVKGSLADEAGIPSGKIHGVPRARLLRIGTGDDASERVWNKQDVESALERARERLINKLTKKGLPTPVREWDDESPKRFPRTLSRARSMGSWPNTPTHAQKRVSAISADSFGPENNNPPGGPEATRTRLRLKLEFGVQEEKPDFVYLVGRCPHDWLFPQCRAVVHHGGAGTTATGLLAGCCTCVVPFFGDQPFWGDCILHQGAGPPPVPVGSVTEEKLADAITSMISVPGADTSEKAAMWDRVSLLSKALQKENGVQLGVQAFHLMLDLDGSSLHTTVWQNQVKTGKGWLPSDRERGWPGWSDRTGWVELHRLPGQDPYALPTEEEMAPLGDDWKLGEWKVWTEEEVARATGGKAAVELDSEGWQYAFNFQKQATSKAWHRHPRPNDVCRRRRLRIERRRCPPLLFLSPSDICPPEIVGYYRRTAPRTQRWELVPRPAHDSPEDEPFQPFTLQQWEGRSWAIVNAKGMPVIISGPVRCPTLVGPGGWFSAGVNSARSHKSSATAATAASLAGVLVVEPCSFHNGEIAERARAVRRSQALTWEKVVVVEEGECGYYHVRTEGTHQTSLVERMRLRRPTVHQCARPGYYDVQLGVLQSLSECPRCPQDPEFIGEGLPKLAEVPDDNTPDVVLAAAEDGALDLLNALVKTATDEEVEAIGNFLTSPQLLSPKLLSPMSQSGARVSTDPQQPKLGLPPIASSFGTPKEGPMVSPLGVGFSPHGMGGRTHSDSFSHRLTPDDIRLAIGSREALSATQKMRGTPSISSARHRGRALEGAVLILQTRLGDLRVLNLPQSATAYRGPSSQSALCEFEFDAGTEVVVHEVQPRAQEVWGRVEKRQVAPPSLVPKSGTASPRGCDGPTWIDLTEILDKIAAEEERPTNAPY